MKNAHRSWILWTTAFGLAGLSATALAGCERNAPASFERPPAPVSVATAAARDVPIYIEAVGRIAAREVVTVQPQVSGRITGIHFADGADVKAGDLLFSIDSRPFRAELNAAEADLARAEAARDLARLNFARVESVNDPRAVSRQDYDARKNAVAVAEAQVRQNRAAVDKARLDLEYCAIRSPIDGRTGQRRADAGNVVKANESPLVVVQRLDPIYADFTVTENDLAAVRQNMARRTLGVEVRLPDEPGDPRQGKLTFVDSSVQEGTGTVRLRATVPNSDRRFWPGRFARIRLILGMRRAAVLIPANAPQLSAEGSFVYVVDQDSTAQIRPVTIGQRQGDLVIVDKGLQAGERVVVTGHLSVTPGGRVRIDSQSPAANMPEGTAS